MNNEIKPIPINEAAAILQTNAAAIRKRIKRGTLEAIKDKTTGRWLIYLDYPQATRTLPAGDTTGQAAGQDTDQIIEALENEIIALKKALIEANNQRDIAQAAAASTMQALINQQLLSAQNIKQLTDNNSGNWFTNLFKK